MGTKRGYQQEAGFGPELGEPAHGSLHRVTAQLTTASGTNVLVPIPCLRSDSGAL